ncbi:hypothetical protein ACFFX0_00125 [Citricoccus parietis]|uniref:Uncharacterized protein n=1 Tax=Citricoccus parietis TaxID=592307 RepID=A0ABV5FSP1_9MICC
MRRRIPVVLNFPENYHRETSGWPGFSCLAVVGGSPRAARASPVARACPTVATSTGPMSRTGPRRSPREARASALRRTAPPPRGWTGSSR